MGQGPFSTRECHPRCPCPALTHSPACHCPWPCSCAGLWLPASLLFELALALLPCSALSSHKAQALSRVQSLLLISPVAQESPRAPRTPPRSAGGPGSSRSWGEAQEGLPHSPITLQPPPSRPAAEGASPSRGSQSPGHSSGAVQGQQGAVHLSPAQASSVQHVVMFGFQVGRSHILTLTPRHHDTLTP